MAPHETKYTEQEQTQNQQPAAEASAAEDPVAHPTDSTKGVTSVADPLAEAKGEAHIGEPEVESAQGVQRSVRPMKGSQRRRSKAEMSKRPDWLPPDWQMELTIRRKGRTAGTYDPHYISPSGVKYRSKIAVEDALKLEEESGNPNAPAASGSGESADSANKRQRLEDEDQEADDANTKEDS